MRYFSLVSALLCLTGATSAQPAVGDRLGIKPAKYDAIKAAMHKWVDEKNGGNVVTLLSRNGRVVYQDAYGVLDYSEEKKRPAKIDSIYRIMSMTKPVIGVAMMIFHDQGKWKLDDLVSKHIPEFANLTVKGVPQETPMTMAQLVSHSAGFPAALTVNSPTLQEIIPPLLRDQLAFQPGRDWKYGPGVEIQGYLIERWAGKDLSDFLQEAIFKPLGLVDTGFFIDQSKVGRVSAVHTAVNGTLKSVNQTSIQPSTAPAVTKPVRLSPSGGLLSTAPEYLRFCQMLLNGGVYKRKRIISEKAVKLMQTNVLQPDVRVVQGGSSGEGVGFGVDFAIVIDQAAAGTSEPKGSFYWGGAYGTWFWIDPVNDVVFIGMIQNSGVQLSGDRSLRQISSEEVYRALNS